ncbi:MAG: hypothetical protein E6R13_03950 [Spirochaetes bacterium]|nr:MAG: hypothetical protein E6R13_03950 [Spirochaetota bacterium]
MEARKISDILGKQEMREILKVSARDFTRSDAEQIANRDFDINNKANVKSKLLKDQALNKKKLVHDRFNPSLFIHPHKKIPIIAKACLTLSELYFKPFLAYFGRVFFNDDKKNKDQSYRKRRSEIREAITHQFVQVLIANLHIGTMTVGCPLINESKRPSVHKSFHFYSIKRLADKAGISEDRAYKIINILKDYHYIEIVEQKVKDFSGSYKSLAPIISVREALLIDLGISLEEIKIEKHKYHRLNELMEVHKKRIEYFHRERARVKQVKRHLSDMRSTLNKAIQVEPKKEIVKPKQNTDKHNDPDFWASIGRMNEGLQGFAEGATNSSMQEYQASPAESIFSQKQDIQPVEFASLHDQSQEAKESSHADFGGVEGSRLGMEACGRLGLECDEVKLDMFEEARIQKEKAIQKEKEDSDKLQAMIAMMKQQYNLTG